MWILGSQLASAAPTCDRAVAAALVAELGATPAAARPEVLRRNWPRLCSVDAWHDVGAEMDQLGDPVRVRLVELQLTMSRAHILGEVCADPEPKLVYSQATKMAEPAGRQFLFERCLLHRLSFYTPQEFVEAPGGAWLSLFGWAELQAGGLTPAEARPLVRVVAGLPPSG